MFNFTESSDRYLEAKRNLLVVEIDELKLAIISENDPMRKNSKEFRLIFANLELSDIKTELHKRGIL